MSPAPVVTLLTDYGLAGEFVGVCHGVITRVAPEARVIDLTHGIPRHDVRAGALTLARSLLYLPVGIHVAIVDPGVGSARRAVAVGLTDGRILVGPDNGLLWPASRLAGGIVDAVEISSSQYRLEPVSATFHGRDIFAPVAAALALGVELADVGKRIDPATLQTLELPTPCQRDRTLIVEVIGIDEFGNAQLGADAGALQRIGAAPGAELTVCASGGELKVRLGRTFSDVAAGQLLLHLDSGGWLAIAINRGSAAERLGLAIGDELTIEHRR